MFRERITKKTGLVPIPAPIPRSKYGSPPRLNSKQILWLTITGLAVGVLVAGSFLPPLVSDSWRGLIMSGYRPVCHQLPGRSFHFAGEQIALCHRCVGIWGALPVAILLFAGLRRWDRCLSNRAGLAILLSLAPLGIDWAGDFAGIWHNTPASRLITGAIFGLVAGYFLARVVIKSVGAGGRETKEPSDTNTSIKDGGSRAPN
ncbi:MAG: DUF2085 domain-containing protein [Rhodothermales bacterium]|nr:DUF2085 domain-containing protein [Rhodothermales bacterium]